MIEEIIEQISQHFGGKGVRSFVGPSLALTLLRVNHQLFSGDFDTLGHLQPATFLLQLEAKSFIK